MIILLLSHALAALLAPVLVRFVGRRAFLVLAAVPAATFCWALALTPRILAGDYPHERYIWLRQLGLHFDFRVDELSWLMALIIGGIGALILVYCSAYFGSAASALGRFSAVFVAFAGAMLGLVSANNTILLYVFWELTTVFSFILIGHYHEKQPSRRAAMQAITVTTLGGLAMLAGLVMLGIAPGGSFELDALIAAARDGSLGKGLPTGYLTTATVLVLAGALSKSAQLPTHFWLPAAMAAPTPVSAYLHAAAMVKAGVYLVARLAPGFSTLDFWSPTLLAFGLATMIFGGYRALRQYDLKLVLAYGTVSQLGFLIALVGFGDQLIAIAGLAMLAAHAMFKAALFLTVGTIDHQLGTRDLRELSGLARQMPALAIGAALALASMAGLPPLLGYVAKEAALTGFFELNPLVYGLVVMGSVLTFGYSLRFAWGAFANKHAVAPCPRQQIPNRLVAPVLVLSAAGLVAGCWPAGVQDLLIGYAHSYPTLGHHGPHLSLWAGFGPAFAASALIIAGGIALFMLRDKVASLQAKLHFTSADEIYRKVLNGLNRLSVLVTATVQRGSLPSYLSVMLMTLVWAVIGVSIFVKPPHFGPLRLWDTPLQAGIALVACFAALLVVRARRRIKAVLLLAFVGYATALLFALQGAPDLALTQAVVETVSLIVFVLVLRRLPAVFSNRPWASSRIRRASIGAIVGITVALLGWLAAGARIHAPVTVDYPEEVLTFGYGRNIVNVTLVDTRAWDTQGEISVLLAAATGVASLIFIRLRTNRDLGATLAHAIAHQEVWGVGKNERRFKAENYLAKGQLDGVAERRVANRGRTWVPGSSTLAPVRRSLVFEIGARLIFHPLILFSIFLLFSGHNNPGGGFAGGVVAGIALAIRYLAGGRYELSLASRVRAGLLLGTGMLIATTAALVPVALGGTILQTTVFHLHLPIFDEVHLATALFFDIGVYLIVVGLVLDILSSLGAEIDRQAEAEGASAPEVAHDDAGLVNEEISVGADTRALDKVGEVAND